MVFAIRQGSIIDLVESKKRYCHRINFLGIFVNFLITYSIEDQLTILQSAQKPVKLDGRSGQTGDVTKLHKQT